MHAHGDVRVEDLPEPTIQAPTDAIIRLAAVRVCGSDLWPHSGSDEVSEPKPTGHEYVGVVEQVESIKVGDFVVGLLAVLAAKELGAERIIAISRTPTGKRWPGSSAPPTSSRNVATPGSRKSKSSPTGSGRTPSWRQLYLKGLMMNVTYDFSGQVALVTGASSGMGLATAQAYAESGAAVVLTDVNETALQGATDDLTAARHQVIGVVCDVADEGSGRRRRESWDRRVRPARHGVQQRRHPGPALRRRRRTRRGLRPGQGHHPPRRVALHEKGTGPEARQRQRRDR